MKIKAWIAYLFLFFLFVGFVVLVTYKPSTPTTTPNQLTALEARVTILEGQVRELRRIVGIDKGLKEGLQNRGKK